MIISEEYCILAINQMHSKTTNTSTLQQPSTNGSSGSSTQQSGLSTQQNSFVAASKIVFKELFE